MSPTAVCVDAFQALEQMVMRAIEVVKLEREARAAAEAEVADLKLKLAEMSHASSATQVLARAEVDNLMRERESVRLRVEKMLEQMDELL